MGRKKKKNRQKIWCFYCDREFADEKVLTDHQKARHFKCPECFKRVLTMGGLLVHMTQVHHSTINKCVAPCRAPWPCTPALRMWASRSCTHAAAVAAVRVRACTCDGTSWFTVV